VSGIVREKRSRLSSFLPSGQSAVATVSKTKQLKQLDVNKRESSRQFWKPCDSRASGSALRRGPTRVLPAPPPEQQTPSAMCVTEPTAGASVHLGSVGAQQLAGEVQGEQRGGGEEEVEEPRGRRQIMRLVRVPRDEPCDGVERRTLAPLRWCQNHNEQRERE